MSHVPLDLHIEVTDANGRRFRWDADGPAGSRPRNLSFRTKTGDGFSDASLQLARPIDRDHADLQLATTITILGADGSVAYEGRVESLPRELTDSESIGVMAAGWMAHTKDRKFSQIYVDRDLSRWQQPTARRRAAILSGNSGFFDHTTFTDAEQGNAGIVTDIDGAWASPITPVSETWYDAGPGLAVGKIAYTWTKDANLTVDGNWSWSAALSTDDVFSAFDGSGNLAGAGPGSGTLLATTFDRKWAALQILYTVTPAGVVGKSQGVRWSKLGVYGAHGIPTTVGEPGEPEGLFASQIIRDLAIAYCPALDPSGIVDSSYVIQHCVFRDRTYPYDAMLEVNKYHLWHLGVWENKKLHFRPYDLSTAKWQVRMDDPGTTFDWQGLSTDDLFNGIVVAYDDVLTGVPGVLTPANYMELKDTSLSNPWNQIGINHWDEIQLSTPTVPNQALQIGRAALADRNRPRTPGTISVKHAISDQAGNDHPVWKVRAGDTITIADHPNDSVRLIVETDYNHETGEIRLAIDRPFQLLDAYLDRVGNAIGARGLT